MKRNNQSLILTCLQLLGAAVACSTTALATLPASAQQQQIQIQSSGGSMSISVTNVNGVKTTKINDNGQKFEFVESNEDGIVVKLTKSYGPDDLEALKEDYPDLAMHVTSFPTETEGAQVELQVNLLKEYKAQNVEQLEKESPEAFKVFEKYTKQQFSKRGIPRLEIAPNPGGKRQIQGDDDTDI
jgi:hypothetical protein